MQWQGCYSGGTAPMCVCDMCDMCVRVCPCWIIISHQAARCVCAYRAHAVCVCACVIHVCVCGCTCMCASALRFLRHLADPPPAGTVSHCVSTLCVCLGWHGISAICHPAAGWFCLHHAPHATWICLASMLECMSVYLLICH